MMKKIVLSAVVAAMGMTGLVSQSIAGSSTAAMEITATVDSYCAISAAPMNFGKYEPTVTEAKYGTGTLTLTCTKGTTPSVIRLDVGIHSGGSGVRTMVTADTGSDTLTYELYKPVSSGTCSSLNTDVWGFTDETALAVTGVATIANPSTFSVCGKIAAGQDVKAGAYADQVTAQVDF